MKKYEVLVEDENAQELTKLLETLPYVKEIKESVKQVDAYTLVSENALGKEWNVEGEDEFQKLYNK